MPSKREYFAKLISKNNVESVSTFRKTRLSAKRNLWISVKQSPPVVDDLLAFDTDLLTTINNTDLKEVHNKFYQNLMMS